MGGAPEELIETWCLYSFGSLVIIVRIACRWRMIGIAGFKPDDYLIFFSWVCVIGEQPSIPDAPFCIVTSK